jgi:hypothetical protein
MTEDGLIYIRCPHCKTLFGIEGDDGVLRVKLKDLYREIEGRVSGPCRKCGSTVVWPSAPVVLVTSRRKE